MKKYAYPENILNQIVTVLNKPEGITTQEKAGIINALASQKEEVKEEKKEVTPKKESKK
jgi:argininosuccinate lyase